LNRTTINFNGASQLTEKLKFDAGVNFAITEGFNRPAVGYESTDGTSLILQFFQFGQNSLDYERLKKYKLPDGTQRTWNRIAYDNPNPRYTDNPYWVINENTAADKRTRWFGNTGLKYDLTNNLYAVGKIYVDTYNFVINEQVAIGSASQSSYTEINRNVQEINYEGRLHFDKKFANDKLELNTLVGLNRRDAEQSRLEGETRGGLATPGIYNLTNSTDDPIADEYDSKRRVNSLFGSASFGYDNIAYLTFTGRNDWFSTLPANNNSDFYPSVNGSLVFSELMETNWLNFGKLRGGWASVSNGTETYNLINTFGSGTGFQSTENGGSFFGNIQFSNDNERLNSELRPETKDTWEIGLEMAFLDNRFSFDLTYYNELTKDLITEVDVPFSTGFIRNVANAGELSNKGIEALVNITPIKTEHLRWDFTWNFSKNKNELLSLQGDTETLQIARFPFNGVTVNAVLGEPYGTIRGTNYVFDDNGNKVVGANGSYLETSNVENLGSVLPDYNMGFRNAVRYKNVRFSFLIDMQKGGKYRSLTNIWGNYSGILEQTAANGIRENGIILEGVTGTVTYDDDGNYTVTDTATNTTRISAQQYGQDFFFGNDAQNVFDADYVKLREITLSYALPNKWLGEKLSSVTLSAFGRNLLVWGLDNENFDPEVATSGSGNIQGSEGGSLPSTRTFGMNVQLKF